MKPFFRSALVLNALLGLSVAQAASVNTIQDLNTLLPYWGATWRPGSGAEAGYHPSFYTGFAMRSQFPDRIHIRQARGNQTRMTVVLDEITLTDYLFDLVKRDDFYTAIVNKNKITPLPEANALPQKRFFSEIIASPSYGIRSFVGQVRSGQVKSSEEIYAKGLAILNALNPGRVFNLNIDLGRAFLKWHEQTLSLTKNNPAAYLSGDKNDANLTIVLNTLLPGRINYTQKASDAIRTQLLATLNSSGDDTIVASALQLFKMLTGTRYQISTVENGAWVPALRCNSAANCRLSYPEFTAIYPTGSVMSSTRDEFGNEINTFSSPGLWNFYKNSGNPDPDRIPNDTYYGWVPKMFYDSRGNAFHNPAVKFAGISQTVKDFLGASSAHSILWAVKRGAVSHGCSRLPTGHIWEMRHILPVQGPKIVETYVFINKPTDFDLYDVDGNGSLEVMGVEYLISYGLKDNNYDKREGANLNAVSPERKLEFYKDLYGAKNVFTTDSKGNLIFQNPTVSMPNHADFTKRTVSTRLKYQGEYPLYEQKYEKDKIQFFSPRPSNTVIRLLGRVRGCAPSTNKEACGEAAFDREANELLK